MSGEPGSSRSFISCACLWGFSAGAVLALLSVRCLLQLPLARDLGKSLPQFLLGACSRSSCLYCSHALCSDSATLSRLPHWSFLVLIRDGSPCRTWRADPPKEALLSPGRLAPCAMACPGPSFVRFLRSRFCDQIPAKILDRMLGHLQWAPCISRPIFRHRSKTGSRPRKQGRNSILNACPDFSHFCFRTKRQNTCRCSPLSAVEVLHLTRPSE